MEVLKKEDVKTLLEAQKSVNRETLYEKEINILKPCEGIRLTTEDWLPTPVLFTIVLIKFKVKSGNHE